MRELKLWGWDLLVNGVVSAGALPRRWRWRVLRLLGLDVSECRINSRGFYGSRRISIGEGAFLNHEVFLDGADQVTIGRRCHIGMRTTVLTGSHQVGAGDRRAGAALRGPVEIGDGAWIGAGVIVMPGVKIGPGCVIAAGSVVTSDCDPDGLYAGTPAARVRDLS